MTPSLGFHSYVHKLCFHIPKSDNRLAGNLCVEYKPEQRVNPSYGDTHNNTNPSITIWTRIAAAPPLTGIAWTLIKPGPLSSDL